MGARLARLALVLALLGGIALVATQRQSLDPAALEAWVRQAGPAAPAAFVLVYALGTVLFVPGSVLTLAGGALFGPAWGTFYNLTGATLGAALAFVIARHLGAPWVERKVGGRLRQLKEGVEGEGWRFVAFVRLVPLFPFNLLNYALGLTRIPLGAYVLTSYLCMLPGALAYTYLGYAGREAAAGAQDTAQKALLALALLAAAAFLPRLVARLRQGPALGVEELKARLDAGEDLLVLDVRPAGDYARGHLPGARNVPLEDLEEALPRLAPYEERPIVVCGDARSARHAAAFLARQGFARVCVLQGGMKAWTARGYPVGT